MTGLSRPREQTSLASPSSNYSYGRNVLGLISQREISPRTKHVPRRNWEDALKWKSCSHTSHKSKGPRDARCGLLSWVEAESLQHLSAKYCPLLPPPRSTIAAAFSPDGKVLASTHGDHTVKIIDCQTGRCLKVLIGHRRTPWVVRFHPLHPEILASGSLDQGVHLWDANTADCIVSHHFYRPIASIAFHAQGEILAVASGHKLYIWHYRRRGEASSPTFVLKTRRSLRAVHFHPHAAPYLLTAEVNDLDSSDTAMTQATSVGYLQYPPPAVFVANVSLPSLFTPPHAADDSRTKQRTDQDFSSDRTQVEPSALKHFQTNINASEQHDPMISPMDTSEVSIGLQTGMEHTTNTSFSNVMRVDIGHSNVDRMDTDEMCQVEVCQQGNPTSINTLSEFGQFHQFAPSRDPPSRDPSGWELPFLHGWLMGHSQANFHSMLSSMGGSLDHLAQHVGSSTTASSATPSNIVLSGVSGGSGLRQHFLPSHISTSEPGSVSASSNNAYDSTEIQNIISRVQSELATSVAAAAAAEMPCTVKLRVWSHDIKNPCAPLNAERCRLTIPHAVLCSEMGAHFSPCGRYLAACVACMLPHIEGDTGLQTLVHQELGAATSPTRHPISAHQVMYELRIYSLEEATFGSVLVSRAIRAAHCLTSIQFSPTSEHILLAYGRRHGSLLKSIVIDGETTVPIYTVLEVYRVSNMELVRVLPSADDEVNVACFHPSPGGGLVYGTKEGKLRILQYDGPHGVNCSGARFYPEESMVGLS